MRIDVNEQVHLSEFRTTDAPALVEHLHDRDIYERTLRIPYPYTATDAEQWLAMTTAALAPPVHFAIRNLDERLIGGCGLDGMAAGERAEVGYWLAKPYWGRGIMTAIVRRLCRHAFDELALGKIMAHVFVHNPASARVLEKCGFQQGGYLRQHFHKDGRLIDAWLFALLAVG
jgi:[ribosomal protein S5]-alanine N-acetyltransferase